MSRLPPSLKKSESGKRNFGKLIVALIASAGLHAMTNTKVHATTPFPPSRQHRLIKPPALKRGDTVGLIAPGGVVDDRIIEQCVQNLESLGVKVKLGNNIRAVRGGYAGTVAQRLDDLHAMFLDREVKAIWAARGGSGCTGLLPGIRYGLIRKHPKILIGFSDITALHLALYRHAGLVTFHGPVAWSTFSDYSVQHMVSVLMDPQPQYVIHMSSENKKKAAEQSQFALHNFRAGIAEGRLIGGNLSVLCALIGTAYAAQYNKKILFLEEISEAPYRIDRMFTQLQQSRGLKHAAGIMLGVFQKSSVAAGEASLSLEEVLEDHLSTLPVPAVYGYSFGHIPHQFTIPIGVRARLNTEQQTLTLLEPAVIN